MPEIRIAPHGSPDYWQAVDLRLRVLRIPLGLNFTQEQLSAEDTDAHLIAIEGDKVVGCLVMTPKSSDIVKMRQVAVEPELQGSGLGTKMVAASEDWAKQKGYQRIELNARDTAVAFYLKLSYQTVGDPFVEVSIPHRKMEKELRKD
jgi:predicted GNAT family N-acyltransferase